MNSFDPGIFYLKSINCAAAAFPHHLWGCRSRGRYWLQDHSTCEYLDHSQCGNLWSEIKRIHTILYISSFARLISSLTFPVRSTKAEIFQQFFLERPLSYVQLSSSSPHSLHRTRCTVHRGGCKSAPCGSPSASGLLAFLSYVVVQDLCCRSSLRTNSNGT